jgi:hypothetical protein
MSVFIEGDKSLFVSKGAIDRFKKDVKEIKADAIDSSKYLKEGFTFKITSKDNNITAIIKTDQEVLLEEKRLLLKQRLNNAKKQRSGEANKQLESLKRSVPDKLFKSYTNLVRNYQLSNIPAPNDVINNPERFKAQISAIMSTKGLVSNDQGMSSALKNYFNTLGKFLGMEDLDINNTNNVSNNYERIVTTNNNDTEDEDENAPELV